MGKDVYIPYRVPLVALARYTQLLKFELLSGNGVCSIRLPSNFFTSSRRVLQLFGFEQCWIGNRFNLSLVDDGEPQLSFLKCLMNAAHMAFPRSKVLRRKDKNLTSSPDGAEITRAEPEGASPFGGERLMPDKWGGLRR